MTKSKEKSKHSQSTINLLQWLPLAISLHGNYSFPKHFKFSGFQFFSFKIEISIRFAKS